VVYGVAQRVKRRDAVVFAELRAAGLEKRLRRQHQDFHVVGKL
jgi:hypothetical protein